MNPTDTTIIEKMRTNPNDGMRLLMDEYQERLYWHVRRLVVYEGDAEDLLQEIFIKIYLKFDSFKGNSSLFSWIYRLATNETLSFLRKKKVSKVWRQGGIGLARLHSRLAGEAADGVQPAILRRAELQADSGDNLYVGECGQGELLFRETENNRTNETSGSIKTSNVQNF